MRSVEVDGAQPYTISIAPGLLADGARLARHVRGRHVLLLSDTQVAPHYAAGVRAALLQARPDLQLGELVIAAGEASKTLDNFSWRSPHWPNWAPPAMPACSRSAAA